MKISFSTLACPNWTFAEIAAAAKDLGYDGIELRGLGDEMYAPALKIFDETHISSTLSKLASLGLTIPILTSGAVLGVHSKIAAAEAEAKAYADLAAKIGAKYIRVMITPEAYPDGGDVELFKIAYAKICEYAEGKGVVPLVETNGLFSDTALLAKALGQIDSQNKGALWDVNHTCRYNNESPEQSIKNIGGYIKHVHLKDSLIQKGVPAYKMLGYGDIPVFNAVKRLEALAYSGYYSLEWVKRWRSDLEEPGVVLSHFISALSAIKNQ
ncbi:MAG: sugar phosphate isomerase/epimerase [Clostridiales bacterium]|jgi:fatty-acyl-CoA synthase|nr:sugar phosphate isomerase/epimerase [Clostridiales bacterium]